MPAFEPLTFHCQAGVDPPLTGVAVKVTEVPAQTELADSEIDTPAVKTGLTVILTVFDVAGLPVMQDRLDVIITYTWSPLAGIQE